MKKLTLSIANHVVLCLVLVVKVVLVTQLRRGVGGGGCLWFMAFVSQVSAASAEAVLDICPLRRSGG